MSTNDDPERAIDSLQELGMKEYEARCFVGLTRLPKATAKELSEVTDVPRTRVYDAIRVLEAKGLVEIHHASPQEFRAVSLSEATETLREEHTRRLEQVRDALATLEPLHTDEDEIAQEVWSLRGETAIRNRMQELLDAAEEEVVVVVGDDHLATAELFDLLSGLPESVTLIVGVTSANTEDAVRSAVPHATIFRSGLEWLSTDGNDAEPKVGRLLLVDETTLLASSVTPDGSENHAVYGRGLENGFVVLARRLISQGLLAGEDPAASG